MTFSKDYQPNDGMTLSIISSSRRYFGDFHNVKVVISCVLPLRPELFPSEKEFSHARSMLGDETTYERVIEKTGVPTNEIEQLIKQLIADFERNSLPYLNAPDFCLRLVATQIKKLEKSGLNRKVTTHD